MLIQFLRKVQNAILLLKFGGPKAFLNQLRRQIYSRDIRIGMEKNMLDNTQTPIECKIKYQLRRASEEDMNEAFQKVKTEGEESVKPLLQRKWLYENGFGNWYIARTVDTNEPCFIQSVILPEDNKQMDKGLGTWFPKLKEDEIILEGAYTFEKYRGNRLAHAIASDIIDIYRKKGFKRMISYYSKDNLAILRSGEKTGFTKFEEVPTLKILFFTRNKFSHSKNKEKT
jgi:GNAT superfamily N-acetyltransferase